MPWRVARATGRVCMSVLRRAISGQTKLFQEPRKRKMPSAASTGRMTGTTIPNSTRSSPAPSTRAASRSSSGMALRDCRIRKIANGTHRPGRISAW